MGQPDPRTDAGRIRLGTPTSVTELAESLPDGLLILDENRIVVRANGEAAALFVTTTDDLVGMDVHQLFRGVDPTSVSTGGRVVAETLSGSRFPAEISQTELRRGGFVMLVRDVTEVANLEIQLRQAQKMEALGRLAGGIAHDFNNYLTVIMGEVDLIGDGLRPTADALGRIRDAADHAAELTNKLLTFSREQILRREVVDLNSELASIDRLLRNLVGEQITTTLTLGSAPCRVHIDPAQFEQTLINIVLNARDAMPDGGELTVATGTVAVGPDTIEHAGVPTMPGEYVVVTVTDTGIGIPSSVIGNIFEPFYTTKPAERGTGLGLAMVKGFVEQSDGTIFVESTPGAGTSVRILLPAATTAPAIDDDVGSAPRRTRPHDEPSGAARIVVAEDDDAVRRFVTAALRQHGHHVIACANATDALAALDDDIDLLLTDIVMAGGSGLELGATATERFADLRVVYMTGYADQVGAEQPIPSTDNVLRKPFSVLDLLTAVRIGIGP